MTLIPELPFPLDTYARYTGREVQIISVSTGENRRQISYRLNGEAVTRWVDVSELSPLDGPPSHAVPADFRDRLKPYYDGQAEGIFNDCTLPLAWKILTAGYAALVSGGDGWFKAIDAGQFVAAGWLNKRYVSIRGFERELQYRLSERGCELLGKPWPDGVPTIVLAMDAPEEASPGVTWQELMSKPPAPVVEIRTLMQPLNGTTAAADRQLAEVLNAGWEILNLSITSVMERGDHTALPYTLRVVTLRRFAQPQPVQPAPDAARVPVQDKSVPAAPVIIPPGSPPVQQPALNHLLADLPLARQIKRQGIQDTIDRMNAEAIAAGKRAYNDARAAGPSRPLTAIPARSQPDARPS